MEEEQQHPEDNLEVLRRESIEQIEDLLKKFLARLGTHMLDLSAKAQQVTSGENPHYEAMNQLKTGSDNILEHFSREIGDFYNELVPDNQSEDDDEEDPDNLGLVDIKDFEDSLAIERMIKRGDNLYGIVLECLIIRLAEIVEEDPHDVRLPVHVEQLCKVFQRSIEAQDIPKKVMPDILEYFGQHFIGRLDNYYDSLNRELRERGVRPDLEEEIRTKGSLLYRPSPVQKSSRAEIPEPPEEPTPEPEEQPEAEKEKIEEAAQKTAREQAAANSVAELAERLKGRPNDKFSPDNLYQSVIDALNFKREADSYLDSAAGGPSSATQQQADSGAAQEGYAESGDIADVLSRMQRDADMRRSINHGASVRDYLANNRTDISGLENTAGLSAQSLNQLDLVDNMFGSINSQLDVTADLKPVLGDLQIPLARLALLEPQFFLDREHAARGVMDKLAQLTTTANFPNKALEGRIQRIIDKIVTDYDTDSAVFNTALTEVDKLVAQQERALTRNVERVVKTEEGQEKLQEAQRVVANVLAMRISAPAAPSVLVDLIDCGWRDLLILTHVKEGPDSTTWTDHIKTLDLLVLWLNEQHAGTVDEDVLAQRGLESEPLIDMIEQQFTAALPTSVDHEKVLDKLRNIFAGREQISMTEVAPREGDDEPKPEEVRAKIENLPRLRRWIRRVEELEKGSWLSYRDKDGKKRRMQLAWVNETRDRYIFVNERGQKTADLSSVQLARQLGRGVQPPPPSEKLSLVDRSMFDTLEHVQKSLSFDKNHDSLTKLINRGTFIGQMARALKHAQRKHAGHAVLCLNIDRFDLVNEVYDRINGDQVLTEFARLLSQLHGRKISSARMVDDEFAVLMLDRTVEQAMRIAEKIRSDIETSSVEIEGEQVTFTVSIGVAPMIDYSPSVDDVLEAAHHAMREAKKLGRNRVVLYEEEKQEAENYQQQMAKVRADIKHTIETDRFLLRAQPIVQTLVENEDNSSLHYELLLTIEEEDGTLVSPMEFIENAERFGYMTMVDRWVVREAFHWISSLIDNQKVVPNISINLSGTSITDDVFMEYLLEQISEFGVGTNRLCFEITETGTISNLVKAADFVRTFRNIGCKFSIDDFGTGLASHNYLRELPVDYVKIDGTFITGIHENRNDYAMARSINDLAHFLGQETIAESVEHEAIIRSLKEIGVDFLQGWGVGKPKLLKDIAGELQSVEK